MQYLNSRIFDVSKFMIPEEMVKWFRPSIIHCTNRMQIFTVALYPEFQSRKVQGLGKSQARQAKGIARETICNINNGCFLSLV